MNRKSRPFISIGIPSLNRIESLKKVIESIIKQDFTDYEIVIVDDHSEDDIEGYIKSLNKKHIRFMKFHKRMGFKKVYMETVLASKGRYVLILGNDDYLCHKQTLRHVYEKITRYSEVGIAKLGLIYYKSTVSHPCFSTKLEERDVYIDKASKEKLYFAVDSYGLTHIAGTIYNRDFITQKSFSNSNMIPFLKTIMECMTKAGLLVVANEYVAVGMSTSYLALFSKKREKNDAWFNVFFAVYKEYIDKNFVKKEIVKSMRRQIPYFLGMKCYIGREGIMQVMKEYRAFDISFLYDSKLYIIAALSFVIPSHLLIRLIEFRHRKMSSTFIPPRKYFSVIQ